MKWPQPADDETTGHLRITSPNPSLDPRSHMLPVHRRPRCKNRRMFKPMTVWISRSRAFHPNIRPDDLFFGGVYAGRRYFSVC